MKVGEPQLLLGSTWLHETGMYGCVVRAAVRRERLSLYCPPTPHVSSASIKCRRSLLHTAASS